MDWCTVVDPDPQLTGVVSEFEVTITYWIFSGLHSVANASKVIVAMTRDEMSLMKRRRIVI